MQRYFIIYLFLSPLSTELGKSYAWIFYTIGRTRLAVTISNYVSGITKHFFKKTEVLLYKIETYMGRGADLHPTAFFQKLLLYFPHIFGLATFFKLSFLGKMAFWTKNLLQIYFSREKM